ncbi:hypothetical protein H072_3761 [Dactylellina haptotyla CBS 200.50]|uniref:Serine hydrolase domain-containing protein n=1 Tax=Dactylellina haptotyla (strain CBS 200.50) TaxID=1284197 RepID=S8AGX5_DACHA|nr:hypothetical protein H072_3761 [Dactylellina haptotyla CBS 200.50]
MHFLCLHGLGTNSKVLETQTAAIRAELGDGHTYDFVDGAVPWPKAPELGDMFSDNDQYFGYYDPHNAQSMYKALLDLENYIETEGPFDGLLTFSHGGALSSSLLLGKAAESIEDGIDSKWKNPFKCAIFLCSGVPWSLEHLRKNELVRLDRNFGSQISIPTAHVWALNDVWGDMSAVVEALCLPQVRHSSIHSEGHTVPTKRTPEIFRSAVNAIRRTIWEVEASG